MGCCPISGDIDEQIEKSNRPAPGRKHRGQYRQRAPHSADGPHHLAAKGRRQKFGVQRGARASNSRWPGNTGGADAVGE